MKQIAKTKEYRETELGELPVDWEIVTLSGVTNLQMGQSPPGETYNENTEGTPFLQGKAEFTELYPKHTKYTTKPLKIAKKDSILISVRAPVGDVNIADRDYCIGRGLAAISPNNADLMFIYYSLIYFKRNLQLESTGSTFKAINKSKLQNFKIPLPPLPEQQKIAYVLSAIQDDKEKTENIINSYKELKSSLMKHLFRYGPVKFEDSEKVKLKETEIGEMPEYWEVKELVDIGTLQRGKDLPKQEWKEGTIPIIGSSGIMGHHDKKVCSGHGVITGRSGSIGKLTYIEGDYWPHNTALYIKDFHGNLPKFVYYLMHLLDFKQYATGVSVPTLNRNFIHSAKLPLPNVSTQNEIVEILDTVNSKIEQEENKKKALEELFKSMLHNLMAAKIRVKDIEVK